MTTLAPHGPQVNHHGPLILGRAGAPRRAPPCATGTLIAHEGPIVTARACSCRSWLCRHCCPGRRAAVRAMIVDGAPTSLLTLTWDAKRPEAPEAARLEMARGWRTLVARVRRRWPAAEFEYFVVPEITRAGYPHLHIALRAPFIPHRWLSDAWNEIVGAPVVWIEAIRSHRYAARYLGKYLTKAEDRLGTTKRYWCSKGWLPPGWRPGRARLAPARFVWVRSPITEAVATLAAAGYAGQWATPDTWTGWRPDRATAPAEGPPP